jgi:hypothetical protein
MTEKVPVAAVLYLSDRYNALYGQKKKKKKDQSRACGYHLLITRKNTSII